jgi:hypothetical protein
MTRADGRGGFRTCDFSRVKSTRALRPAATYGVRPANPGFPPTPPAPLLRSADFCRFHRRFHGVRPARRRVPEERSSSAKAVEASAIPR